MSELQYFSEDEINEVIQFVKDTLAFYQPTTWAWNSSLTSTMGQAHFFTNHMEFSLPIWLRATPTERRETIIHEVCHLAAFWQHRDSKHGAHWRFAMLRCGIQPNVCHNVSTAGLRKEPKRVQAKCSCRTHLISANKAGRIRNGTALYRCRNCKEWLKV